MMWFWIITGLALAVLLLGAWLWDRRWTLDQTRAGVDHRPDRATRSDLGDGGVR